MVGRVTVPPGDEALLKSTDGEEAARRRQTFRGERRLGQVEETKTFAETTQLLDQVGHACTQEMR